MSRLIDQNKLPDGWLAFEINVLRRIQFASAMFPLSGENALPTHLKRWNARIAVNNALPSNQTRNLALIENNTEKLDASHLAEILEDAYIPRHKLHNPLLRNWFNETDSWWFDNVRQRINNLSSPHLRAVAHSICFAVGDYAKSFDENTLELRQPLSKTFQRIHKTFPEVYDNKQSNVSQIMDIKTFIAEQHTDLMFLRLPAAHNQTIRAQRGASAWREDYLLGEENFWNEAERRQEGKLGVHTETKNQYFHLVEDVLRTASHIEKWAISHIESGFISSQEIVDTISRVRPVDTVFTKDFSELTGAKAVIITA